MKKKSKYESYRKRKYLTNDDIAMLNERKARKKPSKSICDTHEDGA